jgi:hypothetical protein
MDFVTKASNIILVIFQIKINFQQNVFLEHTYVHLTSQIYKLHGFITNPCEICYFIGSYWLNTKVMCTIFMCKQHE